MNPLDQLYNEIDTLKPDGSVRLVYDKIGRQIFVLKRRQLDRRALYLSLKKLQSDFLPEIFRLVEFDGSLYVVEEFIEGQTLDEILQYEGALKENQAALILLQLCDCLNQLHALKIVHRDLKPANIMLTRENRIKLIDLGISRIEKESRDSDTQLLGTRGYAPPEQFGFRQTDSRSDIYSLGVTMFQMLGENYRGYLTKILSFDHASSSHGRIIDRESRGGC